MKKIMTLLLTVTLLFGVTACASSEFEPQKMVDRWDRLVETLGKMQITRDADLIGERIHGEDSYVGTYYAECDGASGRDVVFGGTSVKERTVSLQGYVDGVSGTVQLRIRCGKQVEYVTPDAEGKFYASFALHSGGNYLMLDYEDFTGTITLTSYYSETEITV